MRVCPRCGTVREEATPLKPQASDAGAKSTSRTPAAVGSTQGTGAATKTQTDVVPLNAIRQQQVQQNYSEFAPPRDMIFLPPSETERRFPVFTSAQWTLIVIGIGLLILMLAIAFLLWRQQQRDLVQTVPTPVAVTKSTPATSPTLEPSPTTTPIEDQSITEAVRSALMAYNPLGFTRYKFEVKDGVVKLEGEAEHEPEKDGAENVIKLIAGVKSVVNHLKVKPEQAIAPVKLNTTEARLLDEAMRRQIQENEKIKPDQQPQTEVPRDAERQRREQTAAKQREEELALRKAAEDKLRRETEEYESRQEELRRAEAERRARAEQAKLAASILRSGTVAWSGVIDGLDEIIISGSSTSVRHLKGNPPRDVRASFSASIPRSPMNVRLLSSTGRGVINIVQEPSSANGYTTIVRIDDSDKGGDRRYEFTLRWSLQ